MHVVAQDKFRGIEVNWFAQIHLILEVIIVQSFKMKCSTKLNNVTPFRALTRLSKKTCSIMKKFGALRTIRAINIILRGTKYRAWTFLCDNHSVRKTAEDLIYNVIFTSSKVISYSKKDGIKHWIEGIE